jgi:hypothetical protein
MGKYIVKDRLQGLACKSTIIYYLSFQLLPCSKCSREPRQTMGAGQGKSTQGRWCVGNDRRLELRTSDEVKGSALSGFEASSPAVANSSSSVATSWAASRDTEVENGGRGRCLKAWASQFIGDGRGRFVAELMWIEDEKRRIWTPLMEETVGSNGPVIRAVKEGKRGEHQGREKVDGSTSSGGGSYCCVLRIERRKRKLGRRGIVTSGPRMETRERLGLCPQGREKVNVVWGPQCSQWERWSVHHVERFRFVFFSISFLNSKYIFK